MNACQLQIFLQFHYSIARGGPDNVSRDLISLPGLVLNASALVIIPSNSSALCRLRPSCISFSLPFFCHLNLLTLSYSTIFLKPSVIFTSLYFPASFSASFYSNKLFSICRGSLKYSRTLLFNLSELRSINHYIVLNR